MMKARETIFAIVALLITLFGYAEIRSQSNRTESLGIVDQLIRDDSDVRSLIGSTGMDGTVITRQKLAQDISFRKIDLNSDGKPEWIVEASHSMGMCGSGGCSVWIYRKVGNRFEQLYAHGGMIRVKKTRTNGYLDLTSSGNSGAHETYIRTLKFNGSVYRVHSCILRSYLSPSGQLLKRPRILSCR